VFAEVDSGESSMRNVPYSAGLILAAGLVLSCATAQSVPDFQFRFTEKPGPYVVGFKVIKQYDRSRAFHYPGDPNDNSAPADGYRPLQTLVWYPAEASKAEKMTIGDYAALISTETSFDKPMQHGKSQSFVQDFTRGTTALPAWALRNAPLHENRFPLVIYVPGLDAPAFENLELCEYLASQGFVVLATASMGATERVMTADIGGANAEAQDISFLIDYAKSLPDTEISSVAVIGYSWGGMSALFAAARDKRIGAIVSLDGSFRYGPATVQQAGDVHPDQMKIPLLFFSRAEETLESWSATHQDKDQFCVAPNVLNEWVHGDFYSFRMMAMSHIQFSSIFQRSERFRKEGLRFVPADYSLEEGAETYNWVARYTLEFLNVYLKHEAAAVAFLKRTPDENGVPKHLIAASFRPASDQKVVGGVPSAK
jgi:pimeloyl-ACP methyl ester carboxylesterase